MRRADLCKFSANDSKEVEADQAIEEPTEIMHINQDIAKDEVEKLAYQLNEEAKWTERPIRRLNRIIGKLEEGRSVTSVAAKFGIAHSIVSRLWRQFQTTGRAIRGFSSGRPRGTTPADDRYIVLQARRNRRQTAGEIARHTTQATGRPKLRFTVARRLHGGGLFARRPVRCLPLTPAHRRRRFCGARDTGIGETMNGDEYFYR
ncbi:transposable element Tc1 transposase [Trichonephila clavipes]|nr:transposable element Tc1 transposase [Trichonephila clavipes]